MRVSRSLKRLRLIRARSQPTNPGARTGFRELLPWREDEGRTDIVQRPLTHTLDERNLRICKRCRNPGLLNPDQAIRGTDNRVFKEPLARPKRGPKLCLWGRREERGKPFLPRYDEHGCPER